MMERWYYTHEGQRLGPVSAEELDRLTAEGRLLPTDLLWRVGADTSTAVEAGTVLIALAQTTGYVPNRTPAPPSSDHASKAADLNRVPAPSVPAGPTVLPDWLGDIKATETGSPATLAWQPSSESPAAGQPAAPCPDWLHDMRDGQERTATPEAANSDLKEANAASPAGPESISPTPLAAKRPKARPRVNPSSLEALLQSAQHELEAWVDAPANQALIMKGEIRVILGEHAVQTLLARYRSHGAAVQERLRSLLRGLIESRRQRQAKPANGGVKPL